MAVVVASLQMAQERWDQTQGQDPQGQRQGRQGFPGSHRAPAGYPGGRRPPDCHWRG